MDENRLLSFSSLIQRSSIADSSPFPLRVYPFVSRIALIYSLKVPAPVANWSTLHSEQPSMTRFPRDFKKLPENERLRGDEKYIHHRCLNLISIDATTKSNDRFKSSLLFPFFSFCIFYRWKNLKENFSSKINKLI